MDECDEEEDEFLAQTDLPEDTDLLEELVKANEAKEEDEEDPAAAFERRLAYLVRQSNEVFSHFMTENESSSSNKAGKAHHRNRLSEKTEDKQLMEVAVHGQKGTTRLLVQPSSIKGGTMRSYQLDGLNWLIKLHDSNINGILADEMGLGKTLQTISFLAYLKEFRNVSGPHIVIVPKSTVNNWMREFKFWCPDLRVIKILGDKAERAIVCREQLKPGRFDVVVASYESCLRESRYILKIKWKYVIIDEAQRIKNENSSLSKFVRLVPTENKLLITGTPLQNNLHELWALLNFLLPDIFGCSHSFDTWFNTEDSTAKENVIKRLHTVLRPFMLRRVKMDVEKDLLPKKETKLFIGMTAQQRDWYVKILSKDVDSINAMGGADRVKLLNILMQLRKVCNHPYLFDGAEPGPPFVDGPHLWEACGKMTLLHNLLPKLQAQGSRVLIFCQMTRMLDIMEDFLILKRYTYCRLDGSTNGDDRQAYMDDFNRPNSDKFCFLLSTRAGGLGINLQTADTVILYDSDWNPQVDLQAMDRAHRIGQKKEVRVFRFVTEGSVEEKIIERADRKLFLDAAVIQQGRLAEKHGSQLSKGELMTMVRFGADTIMNSKGGTITEEDLDALLARSEERTAALNAKISTEMQHNLANFSLTLDDSQELNLFTFEGENWKGKKNSMSAAISSSEGGPLVISLPQRERKRNYDINGYFRETLGTGGPKPGQIVKKRKSFVFPDFQFFEKARIEEIANIEYQLNAEKQQRVAQIKELKAKELKLRRQSAKAGALARKSLSTVSLAASDQQPAPDSASSSSSSAAAGVETTSTSVEMIKTEEENSLLNHYASEIARIQQELEEVNFELPEDLAQEKATLYSQGFTNWSKNHFKSFMDSLERYGQMNKSAVLQEVAAHTDKSESDVALYYDAFFLRYQELTDWQKVMEKVDRGNKKVSREIEIKTMLDQKTQPHTANPFATLTINYGPGNAKGKFFTEDEDIFLVLMMQKHGYGAWEHIRKEIQRSGLFIFDWYFKSRNCAELQRRCDALLRVMDKEKERDRDRQQLHFFQQQDNSAGACGYDGASSGTATAAANGGRGRGRGGRGGGGGGRGSVKVRGMKAKAI